MIHGSPQVRPSAEDILCQYSDLSLEINEELINLIKRVQEEYKYDQLKFLNNSNISS